MIKVILATTDGSASAQKALDLATDMAINYNARLILFHVIGQGDVPDELRHMAEVEHIIDPPAVNSPRLSGGSSLDAKMANVDQQIHANIGENLIRHAEQTAKSKGVKNIQALMEHGDPAEQILQAAKTHSADLIVMGSRGFSKLKGLFLGSVSHKVFHLAPCSCVTVHSRDAQPALEEIKSIMVPTDGSDQADKAVDIASDIAVKYGANLVLLYVMWRGHSLEELRASIDMDKLSESTREELDPVRHPIAEHVSSYFIPPVVSKDASKEIGEQVLSRGRRTAEAKGVRVPNLMLLGGDPARAIVGAARREQVNLIAMGSRGLGGAEGLLAGSVSYKVNHTAPCSCMIVR